MTRRDMKAEANNFVSSCIQGLTDPRDDPVRALEIATAILRAPPMQEEKPYARSAGRVEHLNPPEKRGPKRTPQNMYRDALRAFESSLRDAYRLGQSLPRQGQASGYLANADYVAVLRKVAANPKIAVRNQVSEVLRLLARKGMTQAPPDRTVRRHLKGR